MVSTTEALYLRGIFKGRISDPKQTEPARTSLFGFLKANRTTLDAAFG